ncbi:hypothetical protein CFOL_v3_20440 [Cephalotus follicularis]|uniref:Uncharacterized protein n=1 Tax=Cephalotus follicularis TaxID=3775 RepID=A0A1Q3C9P8_CEPFO|nr:hypothetical protein CFOL_v3_20440 [Cephalotus follicularis]
MSESDNHHKVPNTHGNNKPTSSSKSSPEINKKIPYPNPPELTNPDLATLRDQWRFATKQFSKWNAHAWGTAILAGVSFFALGWVIKGGNPSPSSHAASEVAKDVIDCHTREKDVVLTAVV